MKTKSLMVTILVAVAGLLLGTAAVAAEPSKTGPEVGTKIPALQAIDQHGDNRNFENLSGPDGLLLLFHRSADW